MKVYCLVFDGFSDWEIGYILPELKNNGVDIVTVGFSPDAVESMGGLNVVPHTVLAKVDVDEADLLIIPGGKRWHSKELADEISEILQKFNNKKKTIAAICGATIALARAGLLNDCKHTSNVKEYLQNYSKEHYRGDQYLEQLAVTDNNIITASGLGSLEFAAEILKILGIHTEDKCNEWYNFFKGTHCQNLKSY
ncbi:MAG: type 1 glutamine amidotransferase family protein [Chlamydiales bacterium]